LESPRRSAQALAPALDDVLRQAGWKPRDVQLVAVTVGPGSFTGLRIGVTTAKTLAYAVGADIIGVNTLEVIACQTPIDVSRVAVAIDAQRRQVYAAEFTRTEGGALDWVEETAIVDAEAWLAGLNERAAASGPALSTLAAGCDESCRQTPTPRLSGRPIAMGRRDDVFNSCRRCAGAEVGKRSGGVSPWLPVEACSCSTPRGEGHHGASDRKDPPYSHQASQISRAPAQAKCARRRPVRHVAADQRVSLISRRQIASR
jgi:tRNA threonylcarbamoyladenosine biosynthesis protein TsaB